MSLWRLKWITSNYSDWARWLLIIAEIKQSSSAGVQRLVLIFNLETQGKKKSKKFLHLEKDTTLCFPKYFARSFALSWWGNKQCWNACCIWPHWKNTIPGISCIPNLLPTILLGETHTHSHIHLLITRSQSKPHTRGPWSPWSPCGKKEKEFVFKWKGQTNTRTRTHKYKSAALMTSWDSHPNYSGIIQNTLIRKNNAGTLNYPLWLGVKSLMITWTDMDWIWKTEQGESGGVRFGGCRARFYAPEISQMAFCPFRG